MAILELEKFRKKVEEKILENISSMGKKTKLRDACEYALLNGGKRLRPCIVLMLAESLSSPFDVMESALAIEYFHTASLIADDLPCMDNDDFRRGKPSLHKVYGEATALLASYSLISEGYRYIYKNSLARKMSKSPSFLKAEDLCMQALDNATYNTGFLGVTSGQFDDIYSKKLSLEELRQVIYAKTVTLYEVAFVFGWLFGGGDPLKLDKVKKASWHFGMAFQIADDFEDIVEDKKLGGKVNFVLALGEKKALDFFREETESFREILEELNVLTNVFLELIDILQRPIKKANVFV